MQLLIRTFIIWHWPKWEIFLFEEKEEEGEILVRFEPMLILSSSTWAATAAPSFQYEPTSEQCSEQLRIQNQSFLSTSFT